MTDWSYADDARSHLEDLYGLKRDDLPAAMLTAQRANICALLAIEERLGQLAEQLKLGTVIAAFPSISGDGLLEMGTADVAAAIGYITGSVGDIVNPDNGFGSKS